MKKGLKEELVRLLDEGATVSMACKKLGIHRSTYYDWQNEDPNLSARISMARHIAHERVTDVAEQWIGKWVMEGDRKSVYKWLEMNHPKFLTTRDRVTMIIRDERTPEEESGVVQIDEHMAFQQMFALRNSGMASVIKMPPHMKHRYEAWLDRNDPDRNHPDYARMKKEREDALDASFDPVEAQALMDLIQKVERGATGGRRAT